MALFFFPSAMADQLLLAANEARRCPNTRAMGVAAHSMRSAVRALSHHDLMLVPGLDHCSPEIDRLKVIAHNMGIEVRPLIVHLEKTLHPILARQRNRRQLMGTTGAGAASPAQHTAPVASTL